MIKFSDLSKGLSTGLIMGLFFCISFRLVGYQLPLSFCFGILGGIAATFVVASWHNETIPISDDKPQLAPIKQAVKEAVKETVKSGEMSSKAKVIESSLSQAELKSLSKKQTEKLPRSQHHATTLLNWLLQQNRNTRE